jgi:hypothetical protein
MEVIRLIPEKNISEKPTKDRSILWVVGMFWFFAIYSIINEEVNLKSFSLTLKEDPIAFYCGVSLNLGIGLFFFILYIKQYNKRLWRQ